MKKLISAIDSISIWTGKISSVLIFIVVFVVLYEVVARYVFRAPTQWGSEAMVMGCAMVYIMAGAWVSHSDKHMKMELLYGRLSAKGKALLDAVTFSFFILYIGMLFWGTAKFSWESILLKETSSSGWNPPVYPLKTALAVGTLLVLLQGVVKFMRDLYFLVKGRKL
jgi:TRAP-type mannitol/chloroaromatic compound transport system permease small subunit